MNALRLLFLWLSLSACCGVAAAFIAFHPPHPLF